MARQQRDPLGVYQPDPMGPIDYQEMTNSLDPLPTGQPNKALEVFAEQERGIGGIGEVGVWQRAPTLTFPRTNAPRVQQVGGGATLWGGKEPSGDNYFMI